jgi:NAD(P)-dependent dehydrogenase (short-subunit alcohol dehydrogenase family)
MQPTYLNHLGLKDKIILVTGASSGIGKSAAQVFSLLGAKILLLGRNEDRLGLAHASLSGHGHGIYVFDLENLDEIPGLLKKMAQDHGPLSGIFHCAGTTSILPINIVKEKYIDTVFTTSIKACLMLARGFCQKNVKKSGWTSLVYMSSAASRCGVAGMSIYSASKAAIDGAIRSLACELAPKEIRVNSIIAGGVKTEMHRELVEKITNAEMKEYEKKHLLGFGSSEDIAYAAAFLLSDMANWITGTTMIVDGGYCCT